MSGDNNSSNDYQALLKGWEITQALAKSNGESAWNMRAWGVTVWCALTAYAYQGSKPEIFIVALVLLVTIFLIELGIRQIQYKFIEKSILIEVCINDILVGDEPRLPAGGISTNIETPTLQELLNLLSVKRWLIWLPYCVLVAFTLCAKWMMR